MFIIVVKKEYWNLISFFDFKNWVRDLLFSSLKIGWKGVIHSLSGNLECYWSDIVDFIELIFRCIQFGHVCFA